MPARVSGSVFVGTAPNAVIKAWKASRFTTEPAYDSAFPDLLPPDAGPVNTGPASGSAAAWKLTLPTIGEDYWISAEFNGHIGWELKAAGPAGPVGPAGPAPAGGADGQFVKRVAGAPAWADVLQVPAGGADGQFVGHVAGAPAWAPLPADVDTPTLAGLADVTLSALADDDVVSWDVATGKWINGPPAAGGASTLAADTDVALTALADDDMLSWDAASSKWINGPPPAGGGGGGAGSSSGALLGIVSLNPGLLATKAVTNSQDVIDPAAVLAVTPPPSGRLRVRISADIAAANANDYAYVGVSLDNGVTILQHERIAYLAAAGQVTGRQVFDFLLTGLTPGVSVNVAPTLDIAASDTITASWGGNAGPLLVEVYDATIGGSAVTGNALLASLNVAAGTDIQWYSTGSAVDVDVDAGVLALTFTAPASGIVDVNVCAPFYLSANQTGVVSIREGGVVLASRYTIASIAMMSGDLRFRITGLAPGSHTFTLGWHTSGGPLSIYSGPTFGPVLMEVFDGTIGGSGAGALGDSAWHVIGAGGEIPFLNGWVYGGAPWTAPRYRKLSSGMVVMSGYAITGAGGAALCQLPPGYRPSASVALDVPDGHIASSHLIVDAAGNVTPTTGGTYGSFIDCTFFADA